MTHLLKYVIHLRENFTVYDGSYVVLAQAIRAPLLTVDTKLSHAERFGVQVQLVSA
jgi:predicted nucleic acid-binding protein